MRELSDWLKGSRRETLKDVAYTLNCSSEHPRGGARLGIVASSLAELAGRLEAVSPKLSDPASSTIRDARGIYFWNEPLVRADTKSVAFLFPGEGSQYPGMLADLCIHFPVVRRLFDTADRVAADMGDAIAPSVHLFAPAAEREEGLWSPATAVNVVLNAQWAMYQLLTHLGLQPDAVVGHSSGELLALAAAGVFPADRVLEQKLGHLGSIFRGFETSGDLPVAHLVAVAADRQRVEAICRDVGANDAAVAMDNCPHQVVLAISPAEFEPIVGRLRGEGILWESLPFSRAYHTASFAPVVGPIAQFFSEMTFQTQTVPIYSCASRRPMPDDVCAVRELAVKQWTTTVAFRETIEAMHADGLRLFVDVGARGNLAGFVEDILRGKPAFAIAANLPRRSGLMQLNHLVASTFAQGVSLTPDYLYARRRPRAIDWSAPTRRRGRRSTSPSVSPACSFHKVCSSAFARHRTRIPRLNIRLTKAWKTAVDPRLRYQTPASIPGVTETRGTTSRCRFRPRVSARLSRGWERTKSCFLKYSPVRSRGIVSTRSTYRIPRCPCRPTWPCSRSSAPCRRFCKRSKRSWLLISSGTLTSCP